MFRTPEQRSDAEVPTGPYAEILRALIREYGMSRSNIEAFDLNMGRVIEFVNTREYVKTLPATERNGAVTYTLRFFGAQFGPVPALPFNCAYGQKRTYDRPLTARVEVTAVSGGRQLPRKEAEVKFGRFPVLLGSPQYDEVVKRGTPIADGEDRHEPGHFIFDGSARQFVQQEMVRFNKVVVYPPSGAPSPANNVCTITTESRWGKTSVVTIYADKESVVRVGTLRGWNGPKRDTTNFNVFAVMAMILGIPDGRVGDDYAQSVLSFVRPELRERMQVALAPTVDAYNYSNLHEEILRFRGETDPRAKEIFTLDYVRQNYLPGLRAATFSHISEDQPTSRNQKYILMAVMVARLLETNLKFRRPTGRDDYANKRFKRYPESMLHLWGLYWELNINDVLGSFDPWTHDASFIASKFAKKDFTEHISSSNKNKWGLVGQRTVKESRYFEDYKDDYYLSRLHHADKVVRARNARSKNLNIRVVKGDQLGRVDPGETPESGKVGLNNTKAIACYTSVYRDPALVVAVLRESGLVSEIRVDEFDLADDTAALVLINAIPYGTGDGRAIETALRAARLNRQIQHDILVLYIEADRVVYINTDSSRPCAPRFTIASDGQLTVDALGAADWRLSDLMQAGVIQFLDTMEEEYAIICQSPELFKRQKIDIDAAREYVGRLTELATAVSRATYYRSLINSALILPGDEAEAEYLDLLGKLELQVAPLRTQLATQTTELRTLIQLAQTGDQIPDNFADRFSTIKGAIVALQKQIAQIDPAVLTQRYEHRTAVSSEEIERDIATASAQLEELIVKHDCDYCEVDPNSMWGVVSAQMPYGNHDPGPRVSFAAKMAKQALGHHHESERWRFDKTKTLIYGQRPLVETYASRLVELPYHTTGFNAIVAVITAHQYSVEDALIVNSGSAERGMGMSIDKRIIREVFQVATGVQLPDGGVMSLRVTNEIPEAIARSKGIAVYRHLDQRGVAKIGSVVELGDCLLGRFQVVQSTIGAPLRYEDLSIYAKRSRTGIVNKLIFTQTATEYHLLMENIQVKSIERGDKLASRHSQKGISSLLRAHHLVPYSSETGMTPDLLFNPHGFVSRMTSGHNHEIRASKAAALTGTRADGSQFIRRNFAEVSEMLQRHGYRPSGNEIFINPETGDPFEVEIFAGPIHYDRLVHEAIDKIQSRATGLYKATTRQPITGKDNGGAMRYGEQERAAIIHHGCADMIREFFMDASDNFFKYVCQKCKVPTRKITDSAKSLVWCQQCGTQVGGTLDVQQPYMLEQLHQWNAGYLVKATEYYRPSGF